MFYFSKVVPNPNEAHNDEKVECMPNKPCAQHIPGNQNVPVVRLQALENDAADEMPSNTILYISIEGLDDFNSFELVTNAGDSTTVGMLFILLTSSDCTTDIYSINLLYLCKYYIPYAIYHHVQVLS